MVEQDGSSKPKSLPPKAYWKTLSANELNSLYCVERNIGKMIQVRTFMLIPEIFAKNLPYWNQQFSWYCLRKLLLVGRLVSYVYTKEQTFAAIANETRLDMKIGHEKDRSQMTDMSDFWGKQCPLKQFNQNLQKYVNYDQMNSGNKVWKQKLVYHCFFFVQNINWLHSSQ